MEPQFRGKLSASLLQKAAKAALEVALPPEKKDKLELSLFITDEPGITALNKKYRKKDVPTDVLSFSFTSERELKKKLFIYPEPALFLGEIILCYPYIRSQCEQEKQPLSEALAWTTIHGVLHLMGRKHYRRNDKQAMQAEEQRALQIIVSQGRKEN